MVNSLEEARAALATGAPPQRLTAAQYLGDHPGPEACAALLAALDETDPQVSEAILAALTRQPVAHSLAGLTALVRETQPHTPRRAVALNGLIEIGARDPVALATGLHHPSVEVRLAIAEIFGGLRRPDAVAALSERLTNLPEAPAVRQAAAQALGKIGDRAATAALLQVLSEDNFWLRCAAIDALGHIGDERALPPLVELYLRQPALGIALIEALGNIGQPEAIETLVAALSTDDPAVHAAALEALVKIISEPVSARQREKPQIEQLRLQLPTAGLVHELESRRMPNSAYAAHLLGQLTPPEALPILINSLSHADLRDESLRYAVVEAILRYGPAAIPELLKALGHPHAAVRENTAELLGLLGDPAAVPALLEHVHDPHLEVRQAVLRALGALGGEAAYAGLLPAIEDPATQDTVLGIIGQTRDARLLDNLQNYLYNGDDPTRRAAARALSLLSDETAVSLLLNAIRLPDETAREAAAQALALVRGPAAINVLIEALGDRDWLVRQKAVEALSYIPDGRAAAALTTLAQDPDWRVRLSLARALARLNDARRYPALGDLARDSDHWIRREVMCLCVSLHDRAALDLLLIGLKDPETRVREAALQALYHQPAPEIMQPITDCLTDPDPTIRVAALRALTPLGPAAAERLALLVYDPVETVRLEVAEALGELGHVEGVDALEVLLKDEVESVQRCAAQALAHIADPAALDLLVSALSEAHTCPPARAQLLQMGDEAVRALLRFTRSTQPEQRRAAAETLGYLSAHRPHSLPSLQLLLSDPDPRVRQAAQTALQRLQA